MAAGVYSITAPSGNRYIGSTQDFADRFSSHRWRLRNGIHPNCRVAAAAKKYGLENLRFEPLLICPIDMLLFYEQRAIDVLKQKYNLRREAHSNRGLKCSDQQKAIISALSKGKKHTPEARARMSAGSKGKPRSSAQMEALERNRAKGKSPEAVAKWRAKMALWQNSPEGRAAMSRNARGAAEKYGLTDAQKAALAAGRAVRNTISPTAEQRAKMAERVKAQWANGGFPNRMAKKMGDGGTTF